MEFIIKKTKFSIDGERKSNGGGEKINLLVKRIGVRREKAKGGEAPHTCELEKQLHLQVFTGRVGPCFQLVTLSF